MRDPATYDAMCPACQTNWITRRWGCSHGAGILWALSLAADDPAPQCPDCDATDAVSHDEGCEFWLGHGLVVDNGPEAEPVGYRFDDLEPY